MNAIKNKIGIICLFLAVILIITTVSALSGIKITKDFHLIKRIDGLEFEMKGLAICGPPTKDVVEQINKDIIEGRNGLCTDDGKPHCIAYSGERVWVSPCSPLIYPQ